MIDQVDINVQALGVLAHRVENPAHGNGVGDAGYDFGPDYINAVSDHSLALGQTMAEPPFELFNDGKTQDRAWRSPYLGGDVTVRHDNIPMLAEHAMRREDLPGSEGVLDPVYSGMNAVRDRDILNPVPPPLPRVVQVLIEPSGASAYSGMSAGLAHEMADPMPSGHALQASAQAVRTIEQTGGTVLNLFA